MDSATKEALKPADDYYSKGYFNKAEKVFLGLEKTDPDNTGILEKLGIISLWKNDTEKAESYFKNSMNKRPGLGGVWPLNAELEYRLGLTYAMENRFKEAAHLYAEAAGPFCLGSKELRLAAKRYSLFGDEMPYVIEGKDETEVDFVILDPLLAGPGVNICNECVDLSADAVRERKNDAHFKHAHELLGWHFGFVVQASGSVWTTGYRNRIRSACG